MIRVGVLLVVLACGAGLLAACGSGSGGAAGSGLPLAKIADAPLPGNPTRFDYQAIDQAARRLYVAHLGDSTLDVVDLDSSRVVATVTGLRDIHGVAVAPD